MDHTKYLLAICTSIILTGCATVPGERTALLSTDEVMSFKTECKYKDSQLEFLRKQFITDRSYVPNKGIDMQFHNGIVRRKMRSLEQWC
jgi:hypothetical protein